MSDSATQLFGQAFGLRVDRARLIESSFPVWLDECVRQPGLRLRNRTCLGVQRRWRRVDEFGRPEATCCQGNIFAVQGTTPWKCTAAESAAAMGMDRDHMSYERLAQSLPPSYTRLIWAQMCMRCAADRYGVPFVTYEEHERDPISAKKQLEGWLRGAGDDRARAGQTFVSGKAQKHSSQPTSDGEPERELARQPASEPSPGESRFREVFYSHVGGFDQQCGAQSEEWLRELKPSRVLRPEDISEENLKGRNTYFRMSARSAKVQVPQVMAAVEGAAAGTRVTVELPAKHEHWLGRLGWKRLISPVQVGEQDMVVMSFGQRGHGTKESFLDHERCKAYMDPRDLGAKSRAEDEKRERAWRPVWWEPEFWRDKGLPAEVERVMTEGAPVEFDAELMPGAIPQYAFASHEARFEASMECDRAVATGHMEYVPADQVEWALMNGVVHPWTMDLKGSKWRACQDYSGGTNKVAKSAPFMLPTTWDVKRVVKPGKSFFCKYDLRDGFWAVPVAERARHRLMMRHPATGRLLQCARLPFGFIDSPRLFCMVTEAIAQEFRKRAAGKGCYILCFVDDFLVIGDDEEAARWGGNLLEELLHSFGFEFAPTKQRGPCQCIEFLGLLIANFEEVCCVALSESRQAKLRGMIDDWVGMRPRDGRSLMVDPTQLAKLLGSLVFASQVVDGGRTYMQGMLAQFKGLEVDWRRGLVRPSKGGGWTQVEVTDGFWRDLEWWSDCFERRNCSSLVREARADAAITGTDASDFGTGQLAWIDGGLDECVLRFGSAEKRRSINWRELLGVLRVVEQYGPQLRGRKILLETDNTSAKGAADKMFSKSEDMQELVRRLLEVSQQHDIEIQFTHTPGAKLDRPDQTSRGDPVAEPRVRWRKEEFETLSRRFGPFTDFMGAERQHGFGSEAGDNDAKIWMHPTFNSVGSGLRLLGSRLVAADGERARGLVVVPDHPTAQWSSFLKYFNVVARLPEGNQHLEMSQWGAWKKVVSLRSSLLLSFPRSAGMQAMPVRVSVEQAAALSKGRAMPVGYCHTYAVGGWHRPALKGSALYSPAPTAGGAGELFLVWDTFDPKNDSGLVDGKADLRLVELVNVQVKHGKGGRAKRSKEYVVDNSIVKDEYGTRPASFSGLGSVPWVVDGSLLWSVDHLVSEQDPTTPRKPLKKGAGQAAQWAQKAFSFDYAEAERQIAFAKGQLEEVLEFKGEAVEPIASPSTADGMAELAHAMSVTVLEGAGAVPGGSGACEQQKGLGEAEGSSSTSLVPGQEGVVKARILALEEAQAGRDLARAKASAEEAVAARVHKDPFDSGLLQTVPMSTEASSKKPHVCRYPDMICAGCRMPIKIGAFMVPAGDGMAHKKDRCPELARSNLLQQVREQKERRLTRGDVALQSAKREAQLANRFSDSRLSMVRCCLDGKCNEHQEVRVMCRGAKGADGVRVPCGRGLHAKACAMVSSYHARTCIVVCVECRALEMAPDCLGTHETLLRSACRSMLVELACGSASTSKNVADFERLEREWMADMTLDSPPGVLSSLREPRHSVESMIAFMGWLVTDAGRARSFSLIMRMAGIAMHRMEIVDLTANPRVKQVQKDLAEQIGVEPEPCDIPSVLVVKTMLEKVLPGVCQASEHIYDRSLVLFDGETAGGARVGEMTGAGDFHGVLANFSDIAVVLEGEHKGLETVNLHIEDSKTKFSRDITYMGVTRGKLALKGADNLRMLWASSGLKVEVEDRDGMRFYRPNFWVVRVNLLMGKERHARLVRLLENCDDRFIKDNRSWLIKYAKDRYNAGTFSEEMRYFNLAGGVKDGSEIQAAKRWLKKYGFDGGSHVVPGPLLRATVQGSPKKLTLMPLQPGSTYAHVPTALYKAWEMNEKAGVKDAELDLLGDKPKFGNHGNRRHADKVATETKDLTGCTEGEIDDHFGWDQAQRKKKSQLHYKGRSDRLKRARVTMMM